MATHDYVLDNATGANFRSDLNNALAAIVSNNSSSSEPSTKYAYQWWADTNEGVLKIRNSSNDGWVTLLQLDGTLTLEDGSASAPALGFRDDLNTGIFSSAADTVDVTCGGTTRGSFSSSGLTVTGNVTATTFVGNVDAVDGDFDGTLEADAITVAGVALATVIAGTTVTTATNANHISVADNESTNEENLIPFIEDASATGNVGLESDGDFSYNPSTGTVTATIFKGNIDAVDGDFDGTLEADAITVAGVALNTVIAGVTVTNATNASHVSVSDNESTNENNLIPFIEDASATGNVGLESDGDFTYNPSTGTVSATVFSGSGASLTNLPAANLSGTAAAINGSNITNVNAATLDSLDSSEFLRSNAADSASGLLTLDKIVCGGLVRVDITSHGGGTITLDFDTSCHHLCTLNQNSTFAQPNNQNTGQTGSIFIVQDGTGSRTATFNSAFKFVGGTAPTLSTAANAVDRIDYVTKGSNEIHCAVSLDIK